MLQSECFLFRNKLLYIHEGKKGERPKTKLLLTHLDEQIGNYSPLSYRGHDESRAESWKLHILPSSPTTAEPHTMPLSIYIVLIE